MASKASLLGLRTSETNNILWAILLNEDFASRLGNVRAYWDIFKVATGRALGAHSLLAMGYQYQPPKGGGILHSLYARKSLLLSSSERHGDLAG